MQPWTLWLCAILGVVAPALTVDARPLQDAPADETEQPAAEPGPDAIRFNFKDATFEQVLEFFSRVSGLPVVWETDPPEGTLSYLSPESYDRDEALEILNIILQARGVMLRVSDDMLYLQQLTEMQRENVPTFVGTIPGEVSGEQIVTVVKPLDVALAAPIAEKMASMVGAYGSLAAMEQQNAIVLTETADQVRRLLRIIEELDREDPEGAIEIFVIEHTKAESLMAPLSALLSRTVERIVLNKQGKPQKIKEQEMAGLAISFDARTNAIVAKGLQMRIDKLREAIELLDVPASAPVRSLRSFELTAIGVDEAVERLTALFVQTPEAERPVIIGHPDGARVTVVGDESQVEDAAQVVAALDGGAAPPDADAPRRITVLPLQHAGAEQVQQALELLLTPRQAARITLVAGPDGASLVAAGSAAEIDRLVELLPALDRSTPVDRRVRVLRLGGEDAAERVARAQALFAAQNDPGDADDPARAITVDYDADGGTLTLVGTDAALDRFAEAVRLAGEQARSAPETRQIPLASARPSVIAAPLARLAGQLLAPREGETFAPPRIEPVDDLDMLVVIAEAAQFPIIESLVAALDRPQPEDYQFRVIPLADVEDVELLQRRAAEAYDRLSVGERPESQPALEVEHDALSGNLVVSGRTDAVTRYERALAEARRLVPPARTARVFPLTHAEAARVVEPLRELLDRIRPLEPGRAVRPPEVTPIEATNSLYVVAEPVQMDAIERTVRELDALGRELPPLRLLDVRAGDVQRIAEVVRRRFDARPDDVRRERPVYVDADPASGALIVTAREEELAEIEAIVAELDDAAGAPQAVRILPVNAADPQALADRAIALYEQQHAALGDAPPLRVDVDAERGALIVVADETALRQFAAIVEQLQRASGPAPDVRLLPLEHADAEAVATTLQDLAATHTALAGRSVRPVPTFEAVPRLNAVLVAAAREQQDVIRGLVEALDTAAPEALPPLRILHLRTADAANLGAALTAQYAQRDPEVRRAQPVTITADAENGALLVAAHPDVLPEIQSVVDALNAASFAGAGERELRLFPLTSARATTLAETLNEMYPQGPAPFDRRGRPAGRRAPGEIVVRADAQTNTLLVDAPVYRMVDLEQLIGQLDRAQPGLATEIRTYPVLRADVDRVAGALRQLSEDGALAADAEAGVGATTITSEPVSRTLIVSAPSAVFPRIEQMLDEIDARPARPATALRFFRLERARAEGIVPMLRELLVTRLRDDAVPGREYEALLHVAADRQTNTIILSAPEPVLPAAEELIRTLDEETAPGTAPTIRMRPLLHADARGLAGALGPAIARTTSSVTGAPLDVEVTATPGSNAVILVGPEADLAEVEAMIARLDVPAANDAVDARQFELQHAEAAQVAPVLRSLLADGTGGRRTRRPAAPVRVEADARTNSLLVSGPPASLAIAARLIEQLDAADGDDRRAVRVFRPVNAEPARLAATVQRVLDATREPGGVAPALVHDDVSGTVIVAGRAGAVERAVTLLGEQDELTRHPPPLDLRVVPVTHRDAQVVASAVTPLLADRSRWPEDLAALARTGAPVGEPTVTADAEGGRLLISAPTELMDVAVRLVEELDQPRGAAETVDVRVFTLTRAKADAVATAIDGAMAAQAAQRTAATPPTVVAEPSSNALVVAASPDDMEAIAGMVERLDAGQALDQAQLRTIFLEHARAEAVVPIVRELLAGEDMPIWYRWEMMVRNRSGASAGGAAVRVTADRRLNAIVVSGPPAALAMAETMIRQLDVDGEPGAAPTRAVRVLRVANADVQAMAENLMALFDEQEDVAAPPTIRVDRAASALIVQATPAQFETIARVVTEVDRAAIAASREMRVIPIDPARISAGEVARTLERLLGGAGERGVEVMSLDDLLERQRPESEDEEDGSGGEPSASARPRGFIDVVAAAILGAPIDEGEDDGAAKANADADDGADVTIAVDEASNALVIIGSSRAIERVEALAQEVQSRLPEAPGRVRYVALPAELDAGRLAQMIDQTMRQLTPAGGRRGDLRRRAVVIPDEVGNALLIVANDVDFATIGSLVATLAETPASEEVLVKVYPLRTVTAERAAESVRRLLGGGEGFQAQRMRSLAVRLLAGEREVEAVLNPAKISVSADEPSNALVVMAPPGSIAFIDRYVELIDQTPVNVEATLKVYPLRHARAELLRRSLRSILQARFRSRGDRPDDPFEPEIEADERTNTLIVTAAPEQLAEIDTLLAQLDRELGEDVNPLRTIQLAVAVPSEAADLLKKIVIGTNQARRASTLIEPDDRAGVLLVRADATVSAEIDRILAEIDRESAREFPVRTITLERADASAVAEAVQRFYDDRARIASSGRGRREQSRTVSIIGDTASKTLLVAASDEDFTEIQDLVAQFDSPEATDAWTYRVYRLEHAKANEIAQTMNDLIEDLTWNQGPWFFFGGNFDPGRSGQRGSVAVRAHPRLNALIATGEGDKFLLVEELIALLDAPQPAGAQRVVRLYPVRNADPSVVRDVLLEVFAEGYRIRRWWEPEDPTEVKVRVENRTGTLIVSGTPAEHEEIAAVVRSIDEEVGAPEQATAVLAIEFAEAADVARTLERFMADRVEQPGGRTERAAIAPSTSANSIVVSGSAEAVAMLRDLVAQLDQPNVSGDRAIEIVTVDGGDVEQIARIVREQFGRRGGQAQGVIVTSDPRSGSLILNAPRRQLDEAVALIQRLDDVPAATPVEYHTITLEHAPADDVAFTLERVGTWEGDGPEPRFDYNRVENQLIVSATTDQFEQIKEIIAQLDKPSVRARKTDFVPLKFAEAEKIQEALSMFYGPYALEADTPGKRNVRIVADPATNSLVITADDAEWTDISALLARLDSEEYDASLQLRVIPLTYADARSVATAINDAFQGRIERGQQGQQPQPPPRNRETERADGERREPMIPAVLVEAEEWVRVAAETQTNSVIVSASRQNVRKIEQIVEQLDVADYAKLPAPQIIPVKSGDPGQLAESLRELYAPGDDAERGRKAFRIVGDAASRTLIVRAEPEEFEQIRGLAESIQEQSTTGVRVHVLHLASAPARRVADALRDAYAARAERLGEPLSIRPEPAGNSLIVASTPELFREIEVTVKELDALSPAAGQSIFIIELEHVAPEAARELIETIELDQPADEDTFARLVSEPVKVAVVPGRSAIIVVASPADRDTIVAFLKAVDREPELAEARVRVVPLRNAEANALASLLTELFAPANQQVETPLARAVQEQIRRLSVRRNGLNEGDLSLDLTQPIRIVAAPEINALLVSSEPGNVEALVELIGTLDTVPVTDAVMVRIFPLENIAADEFRRILRELFEQGRNLGRVPGTERRAVPGGTVGRAMVGDVAISVDERTNTVVVAGNEDAVALVEVLTQRLDANLDVGWVEPRIVALRYADATSLAQLLRTILIEGATDLPQSTPLQRQIARLRVARMRENGGAVLESDVFQPMTRLVITPEPQLNALVLVGTPVNLEVVSELAAMLDVEAASPDSTVRIYPVENASAQRLATIITDLFDKQAGSKAIRPEDRVIIAADDRTNALVVTTSPRSFAVLERLLEALDRDIAPDLREVNRIEVAHASAARLGPIIQQLMDARVDRLRTVQPETADLARATIIADPRTNSLIIAAGHESFEMVKAIAGELDSSTQTERPVIEVIPIDRGNVERLSETLDAIMQRRYADLPAELRQAQMPLILTDPRTSSLLVAASPEDLTAIRSVLDRLDEAPIHPAVQFHVISLPVTTSAVDLAPRLQRLMRERQESLGDGGRSIDRVSVDAEPDSNALIVAASDENIEVIRELVGVLTAAEADAVAGRAIELIPLGAGRASDVVDLLDELYVREANRDRGEDTVQVTADDRINAVLVNAPPGDVEAIRQLVRQLDTARPSAVVEIKYIPLESANALETVRLIENILSGRGLNGRRTAQQATVLKYLHELVDETPGITEMEVSAAVRETITLTPDVRTNTIIVAAPQQSMSMIERMIRDLDQSNTGAKSIRIFKLVNADAQAMAEILAELFSLQQGNDLLVLRPRETGEPGPDPGTGDFLGGTELTAVPDERQQLAITVDARTNSLLVSGTPRYLDLVEEVVIELDALKANEREVFSYQLRNARALDVAQVISDFVREEQEKLISTLGDDEIGASARLLEREVTIQGDQQSNTVLVSASPRYVDRVRTMISELDIDPPQVLIQVLLAEVTLDSQDDWGFDGSFEFNVGDALVSGGYGLGSALLNGFGIPGTNVPTVGITSSDFALVFRALQAQGRVALLSNPSVMAANNEPARIQIGETIQIPEATSFTEAGTSQTALIERDTGVILEVTPSINPDGFVRMLVTPTISVLSEDTTQITENLESPIIDIRTASTTVTVQDGQTIVIGGLIQDRLERRERKVPFFGDIPLIGAIFRSSSEDTRKTELLIVLTPHVIDSPSDLQRVDQITDNEIERLTLPEEVKQRIREGKFDLKGGLFDAEGNPIEVDWGKSSYWEQLEENPTGSSSMGGSSAPEAAAPE